MADSISKLPTGPNRQRSVSGVHSLAIIRLFKPSLEALLVNMRPVLGLFFSPLIALLPFTLVAVIISVVLNRIASAAHTHPSTIIFILISLTLYIAMVGFLFLSYAALVYATLQSAKGKKTTVIGSWKVGWHVLGRFIGLSLTTTIITLLGFCLVVPGFFMLKRYYLAPLYLIDHNRGIAEAMKQSAEDSKKYGGLWSLIIATVVVIVIGVYVPLGWLVALVAFAFYTCAPAVQYVQIQQIANQQQKKTGKKGVARPRSAAA